MAACDLPAVVFLLVSLQGTSLLYLNFLKSIFTEVCGTSEDSQRSLSLLSFPSFFKLKLPRFKVSRAVRVCCYVLLCGDAANERCPLCPVLICPARPFWTCLLAVIGNIPEITRGHKVMYREYFNLINILMISF